MPDGSTPAASAGRSHKLDRSKHLKAARTEEGFAIASIRQARAKLAVKDERSTNPMDV